MTLIYGLNSLSKIDYNTKGPLKKRRRVQGARRKGKDIPWFVLPCALSLSLLGIRNGLKGTDPIHASKMRRWIWDTERPIGPSHGRRL